MAEDGAEDGKSGENGGWEKPIATDSDIEGPISSFVEAMFWIAVAGKDGHLMTTVLQSYSSINDESFGTSYPQVRMEE